MHIIRLRRPWSKVVVDSDGNEVSDLKANVPDSDSAIVAQRVSYSRSFNRPTGLSDQSRVFMAVSDWQGRLDDLIINQRPFKLAMSRNAPLRIEVTSQLAPSNKLEIQIMKSGDQQPLLSGSVQIEIDD